MSWAHSHLPRNSIAVALVLVTLLLCGGGLVSWNKKIMAQSYQEELAQRNSPTPSVPKMPTAEVLRKREKINIYKDVPEPLVITPSGMSHLVHHIPTDQKVVFITIDDGITKEPRAAHYMTDRNLPITAFLTINDIKNDLAFFEPLLSHGTTIQNHSVSHPVMRKLPYEQQKEEICHTSELLQLQYGQRPQLFRPPYGEYNDDTLRAAADCGIKAVILWSAMVQGGTLHYQVPNTTLKPGDIILLHYKPELQQELENLLKSITEQGFQVGRLEDWVQ